MSLLLPLVGDVLTRDTSPFWWQFSEHQGTSGEGPSLITARKPSPSFWYLPRYIRFIHVKPLMYSWMYCLIDISGRPFRGPGDKQPFTSLGWLANGRTGSANVGRSKAFILAYTHLSTHSAFNMAALHLWCHTSWTSHEPAPLITLPLLKIQHKLTSLTFTPSRIAYLTIATSRYSLFYNFNLTAFKEDFL